MPPEVHYERESPPVVLAPLSPSPRPQPLKPECSLTSDEGSAPSPTRVYPGSMRRPFPNPHEALCHFYNVAPHRLEVRPGCSLPPQIDMLVLQDAHMPTHVLALTDSPILPTLQPNPTSTYPILSPVNAELFSTKFANDVAQRTPSLYEAFTSGFLFPVPFWDKSSGSQMVTLPVIPLVVPHPASLPLLLFYGMGLHKTYEPIPTLQPPPSPGIPSPTQSHYRPPSRRRSNETPALTGSSTGLLATYLLPMAVIEEYPAANAMAEKMVEACTDGELDLYASFNRGLWRNVLFLAPADSEIIDLVRLAWNVTKEARWLKDRSREFEMRGRRPSLVSLTLSLDGSAPDGGGQVLLATASMKI